MIWSKENKQDDWDKTVGGEDLECWILQEADPQKKWTRGATQGAWDKGPDIHVRVVSIPCLTLLMAGLSSHPTGYLPSNAQKTFTSTAQIRYTKCEVWY